MAVFFMVVSVRPVFVLVQVFPYLSRSFFCSGPSNIMLIPLSFPAGNIAVESHYLCHSLKRLGVEGHLLP